MTSPTVFILGGAALVGLGTGYLLSENFARKLFYKRPAVEIGGWWQAKRDQFDERFEHIGVRIIRFLLGPALIVLGAMLVAKGL